MTTERTGDPGVASDIDYWLSAVAEGRRMLNGVRPELLARASFRVGPRTHERLTRGFREGWETGLIPVSLSGVRLYRSERIEDGELRLVLRREIPEDRP